MDCLKNSLSLKIPIYVVHNHVFHESVTSFMVTSFIFSSLRFSSFQVHDSLLIFSYFTLLQSHNSSTQESVNFILQAPREFHRLLLHQSWVDSFHWDWPFSFQVIWEGKFLLWRSFRVAASNHVVGIDWFCISYYCCFNWVQYLELLSMSIKGDDCNFHVQLVNPFQSSLYLYLYLSFVVVVDIVVFFVFSTLAFLFSTVVPCSHFQRQLLHQQSQQLQRKMPFYASVVTFAKPLAFPLVCSFLFLDAFTGID